MDMLWCFSIFTSALKEIHYPDLSPNSSVYSFPVCGDLPEQLKALPISHSDVAHLKIHQKLQGF